MTNSLPSLKNPVFVGDQPAGTMTAGWLNAWMTTPSAYAVAARSSADVVAAVNFAREHRLRVVIKGGGHSYQGTSESADSLLIWTRPMNQITMRDTFVGRGCEGKQPPMPAVSVGAGCIWMHVYDANEYKFIAAPAIHGRAARDYWNAEILRTEAGRGFADTRPGAPANNVWFAEENTELGIFMHGFQSV
jgi:hypothetical protein